MDLKDFNAKQPFRPEPNVQGSFSCQTCSLKVREAYLDSKTGTLYWWCYEDHESAIEEFQ